MIVFLVFLKFLLVGVSTAVAGSLWVLYYQQYIKDYGWFTPIPGKASFLGAVGICHVFLLGFVHTLLK